MWKQVCILHIYGIAGACLHPDGSTPGGKTRNVSPFTLTKHAIIAHIPTHSFTQPNFIKSTDKNHKIAINYADAKKSSEKLSSGSDALKKCKHAIIATLSKQYFKITFKQQLLLIYLLNHRRRLFYILLIAEVRKYC